MPGVTDKGSGRRQSFVIGNDIGGTDKVWNSGVRSLKQTRCSSGEHERRCDRESRKTETGR